MQISKFYDLKSSQEIPDYPEEMSVEEQLELLRLLEEPTTRCAPTLHAALTAVTVTFALGQRIADMLQLLVEDLTEIPETSSICITVRRGKVIAFCKPYCLHINSRSTIASHLRSLCRGRQQQEPLFGNVALMQSTIRQELKSLRPELELRSIRRGGLCALARTGLSLQQLRTQFSQHASDQMLLRYIRHGAHLMYNVAIQHCATEGLINHRTDLNA
jgi:hypothetical protein